MPLLFFRRKKSEDQAQRTRAPERPEAEPLTAEPSAAPAGTDGQSSTTQPKKRRRGTRGGRNRKKASGAGAATATVAAPAAATDEPKKAERKPRTSTTQTRRRTPPKRAPLPKAKRELLVSVDAGEKRVAVLEDDQVAEVYLERPERRSIAGNIYLGVVDNVLPGMEAAFVEIGLEKNGFLYVDEIVGPELEGRKGARKIQDLIKKGENVLVQAVKDPMKTKGARLTTEISLPGRFVVYVPHGEGLGVSRRLDDDERNRLKTVLKEHAPKRGGVIVRTAAEGASAEDIERDLDFLQRLWRSIEAKAKESKAPSLVYQEAELPLRVVRDLFTGDFERLLVDHDRTYKRIVGYLKKTSPHMAERVTRYKEREPLMEAMGVDQEIRSTLSRRVDLPSGGYLIFDYAEAFTVIDVNTGRFVGSRSKKSGARLEDTITKNNLEAVKEVVRQLRLRDIGGIIVIDFIDMASPKNRAAVETALGEELERDRTKTYVVEISPLGLVEMTRQNVTDGPREVMTKKCPTCGGDGIVISEHTAAVDIERRLRSLVTPGSRDKAFKVEVSARVAWLLAGPGGERLRELEETTQAPVLPRRRRGRASRSPAGARSGNAREGGAEAPGRGRATGRGEARRGRVARSARRHGQGRRPRHRRRGRGQARRKEGDGDHHRRHGGAGVGGAARTGRPARGAAHRRGRGREADPRQAELRPQEHRARAARATGSRAARWSCRSPCPERMSRSLSRPRLCPRPRTPAPSCRRSARGAARGAARTGRRSRPPQPRPRTAASLLSRGRGPAREAEPAHPEPAQGPVEPEPGRELVVPVIHVPERALDGDAEGGDGAAPVKKKTRRGSRGGKNRRKKPAESAVATAEPETAADAAPGAPEPAAPEREPSDNGDVGDWGYTPMSQWGLDE